MEESLPEDKTNVKDVDGLFLAFDESNDGATSSFEPALGACLGVTRLPAPRGGCWLSGLRSALRAGTLDVSELKQVLKGLKDAAVKSVQDAIPIREAAELLRLRAGQTSDVAKTTSKCSRAHHNARFRKACDDAHAVSAVLLSAERSEQADARFEELRSNKSCGARLGALLIARNVKVTDVVTKWDPTGDGVDKVEFRQGVLGLGLAAEPYEIDDLFEELDDDGGGTLDVSEIKASFKALQEKSGKADVEIATLKKTIVELAKVAKVEQIEMQKLLKVDETAAAERAAAVAAEQAMKLQAQQEAKEKRAAALAQKRAEAEEEKRAFEAKVIARRNSTAQLVPMTAVELS